MNKIFKLVWSKTRNMYVAVCEFAKSCTKTPSASGLSRALVVGVLTFALSSGVSMSVTANYSDYSTSINGYTFKALVVDWGDSESGQNVYSGFAIKDGQLYTARLDTISGAEQAPYFQLGNYIGSVGGGTITKQQVIDALGYTPPTADTNTTYSAGNGLSLSGTTFSAKAGTNVTVNSNGISVTGNGSVASGNTGLIDGGKLYAEVRPSDNGNYVETSFAAV